MAAQKVEVRGAPGYEDFEGTLVPGLHEVSTAADEGPRTVLLDRQGEPHVILSKFVHLIKEGSE